MTKDIVDDRTLAFGQGLFTARRRIARIYLLDAIVEIALVGAWLGLRRIHSHGR